MRTMNEIVKPIVWFFTINQSFKCAGKPAWLFDLFGFYCVALFLVLLETISSKNDASIDSF